MSKFETLMFNMRIKIKRLFCKHDFKYTGKRNGYFTETCKKCGSVSLEKEYEG